MNDLNRALGDIRTIRRQVALTTDFRGYGPLTLLLTAAFAAAAGWAQSLWVPEPVIHPMRYVTVWAVAACLSIAVIGISTLTRTRRIHSGIANEMIRMAAEQFAPAFIAGALLTLVILAAAHHAPSTVWMLSGLWQIIYSLGIFASCRFLPRAMAVAGVWYLCTGLLCISLTDARALSPWHMTFAFTVGQTLIAAILQLFSSEPADEA